MEFATHEWVWYTGWAGTETPEAAELRLEYRPAPHPATYWKVLWASP